MINEFYSCFVVQMILERIANKISSAIEVARATGAAAPYRIERLYIVGVYHNRNCHSFKCNRKNI